jgi:transcriptional regulator with XRE-family HTH domain
MTNKAVGRFLLKHRESLGLNQSEMAKKIGVSVPLVCKLEAGRLLPSRQILPSVSEVYKIPFFELIGLVYGQSIPSLDRIDLVPLFKRIMSAGIENFSLNDLYELLEMEKRLGFVFEDTQLKVWHSKRVAKV